MLKTFFKHAHGVLYNTDFYLPKTGLVAMTGGLLASAVAHEAELRVIGVLITIIIGVTVILINIPKIIMSWKNWLDDKNEDCDV